MNKFQLLTVLIRQALASNLKFRLPATGAHPVWMVDDQGSWSVSLKVETVSGSTREFRSEGIHLNPDDAGVDLVTRINRA